MGCRRITPVVLDIVDVGETDGSAIFFLEPGGQRFLRQTPCPTRFRDYLTERFHLIARSSPAGASTLGADSCYSPSLKK